MTSHALLAHSAISSVPSRFPYHRVYFAHAQVLTTSIFFFRVEKSLEKIFRRKSRNELCLAGAILGPVLVSSSVNASTK